ncbi:MAG: hypothetical protein M3Z26_00355 [Bacteroidota bacterium]|nr:hypothetical protein [Bacteroidota bacterium]
MSKEKIFVDKISKNLEDDAFTLNGSLNIIEIKINKVQTVRLDSLYGDLAYGRLTKLFDDLKKNNSQDYASIDKDEKLQEIKSTIKAIDKNLKGSYVWYYIKGTYTNKTKNQSNIIYESVLSYFDNNSNLLHNNLYFDDWGFAHQ